MGAFIDVTAQCRLSNGGVHNIQVLDISEAGCLIDRRMLRLQDKDRVLIKLPDLAYQGATVLWVEDDRAGLGFEQPLYGAVLSHLKGVST